MSKRGIKFSMAIRPEVDPEELRFAVQLGVPCVYVWVRPEQRSYAALARLRETVESYGLELYMAGAYDLGKSDKIHLALPGRDEDIAQLQDFVRALGRAGIRHTTFTWEPDQVWSSAPSTTRGGAATRHVDLDEMKQRPFTHDRAYTEEEMWANFEYFIKRMIPVCEEADVRLCLHPNDPPVDALGGIPCLIHDWASYDRAFAIADSPYLGMEFCCGCWLEGGAAFGNILEGIRHFHAIGKIFIVHFRNITSPLPIFDETFLDDGYMDMYQVMKTFCEVGYSGSMTLDHTPRFVGDYAKGAGTAYAIGYMRALVERAKAELGE
ncbi:MAG: mannonate dehydratase [Anaerolineae bacterium]|jgi:mannonate dehydratase|nr:mannonate dehydratase [Anaerolineae bacterium]